MLGCVQNLREIVILERDESKFQKSQRDENKFQKSQRNISQIKFSKSQRNSNLREMKANSRNSQRDERNNLVCLFIVSLLQFLFFLQTLVLYVLIFCVELWELSHLTPDLSQAEKKLNVDTSCTNAQYDIYFTQNGQSCHFVR